MKEETREMEGQVPDWQVGQVIDGQYEIRRVLRWGLLGPAFSMRKIDAVEDLCCQPIPRSFFKQVPAPSTGSDPTVHPSIRPCWSEHGQNEQLVLVFSRDLRDQRLLDWVESTPAAERHRMIPAILNQVAQALDLAHSQGQVHGALNPSTLLVEIPEGPPATLRASIEGFGLWSLLDRRQIDSAWPSPAEKLAHDRCQSAEQRTGRTVTPATDRWALAAIAAWLFVKEWPACTLDPSGKTRVTLSGTGSAVEAIRKLLEEMADQPTSSSAVQWMARLVEIAPALETAPPIANRQDEAPGKLDGGSGNWKQGVRMILQDLLPGRGTLLGFGLMVCVMLGGIAWSRYEIDPLEAAWPRAQEAASLEHWSEVIDLLTKVISTAPAGHPRLAAAEELLNLAKDRKGSDERSKSKGSPSPSPVVTQTPGPTPSPPPDLSPSPGPGPSPSPIATQTPDPTPSPSPVATQTPSPTPSPVATATPGPTPPPVATETPGSPQGGVPADDRPLRLELASSTPGAVYSLHFTNPLGQDCSGEQLVFAPWGSSERDTPRFSTRGNVQSIEVMDLPRPGDYSIWIQCQGTGPSGIAQLDFTITGSDGTPHGSSKGLRAGERWTPFRIRRNLGQTEGELIPIDP